MNKEKYALIITGILLIVAGIVATIFLVLQHSNMIFIGPFLIFVGIGVLIAPFVDKKTPAKEKDEETESGPSSTKWTGAYLRYPKGEAPTVELENKKETHYFDIEDNDDDEVDPFTEVDECIEGKRDFEDLSEEAKDIYYDNYVDDD